MWNGTRLCDCDKKLNFMDKIGHSAALLFNGIGFDDFDWSELLKIYKFN